MEVLYLCLQQSLKEYRIQFAFHCQISLMLPNNVCLHQRKAFRNQIISYSFLFEKNYLSQFAFGIRRGFFLLLLSCQAFKSSGWFILYSRSLKSFSGSVLQYVMPLNVPLKSSILSGMVVLNSSIASANSNRE